MATLYSNPHLSPAELRGVLYRGDLVIFNELVSVHALVGHAREELGALFSPYDPRDAHLHWSPADVAQMLGKWKPAFIHSPRSRELVASVVEEIGCDPETTYLDVPKPRTSFPVGHLTTGIAYAFPWHRDTWYAAPDQQINWWLPIFEVTPDNAMIFDMAGFGVEVANTSAGFDYYEINRARTRTAEQVGVEVQSRPGAPDHVPVAPLVVIGSPGSVLLFAGAQLHASIPNTSGRTRFSIDFRTVDLSDVESAVGASTVDASCTGTALRDFTRLRTRTPIDEALVRRLHGEPPADAVLVFGGPEAGESSPASSGPG